jgi:4-amino-4-deoxychorismate lyase
MRVEFSSVPKVSLEALFPSTLDLPLDKDEEEESSKSFQPSPLTGGALNMGPTDFQPAPPQSSLRASYSILLDSQSTPFDSHTIFKTTHRPHYDSSRSRNLSQNLSSNLVEEVLLYNPSGKIMEGSLTTPYFYRNGRWVTPPVWEDNHGGQRGTTRRYAIEKKLCTVEAVSIDSLKNGERIWISNGVRGFGWGLLKIDTNTQRFNLKPK